MALRPAHKYPTTISEDGLEAIVTVEWPYELQRLRRHVRDLRRYEIPSPEAEVRVVAIRSASDPDAPVDGPDHELEKINGYLEFYFATRCETSYGDDDRDLLEPDPYAEAPKLEGRDLFDLSAFGAPAPE